MSTPLYDALTQFAAQNPLRMAMPGHKGKPIPGLPAEYLQQPHKPSTIHKP